MIQKYIVLKLYKHWPVFFPQKFEGMENLEKL